MDPQRTDMLRGAFGMTATAAAAPKAKPKTSSDDLYDRQYKKFVSRGMSPKQAAALATQIVNRTKGS